MIITVCTIIIVNYILSINFVYKYVIKARYWMIRYMCVPRFHFLSKSMIFMLDTGNYTPKSPCSSANGLHFTMESSSRYVPVRAVPSVSHEGYGVLHMWCTLYKTSGRGVLDWVKLRRSVKLSWRNKFIAPIPIKNPNPSLDPGSIRDLEHKLQGASGSTTSWLRFQSGC